MNSTAFSISVTLRHVEYILVEEKLLKKSFNLVFIGPPFLEMHMRFAEPVIVANVLEICLEET